MDYCPCEEWQLKGEVVKMKVSRAFTPQQHASASTSASTSTSTSTHRSELTRTWSVSRRMRLLEKMQSTMTSSLNCDVSSCCRIISWNWSVPTTVTSIAPWCYQQITSIATWCHQQIASIATWCHQQVASIATWCHQQVASSGTWCQQQVASSAIWCHQQITVCYLCTDHRSEKRC